MHRDADSRIHELAAAKFEMQNSLQQTVVDRCAAVGPKISVDIEASPVHYWSLSICLYQLCVLNIAGDTSSVRGSKEATWRAHPDLAQEPNVVVECPEASLPTPPCL